MLYYYLWMQVMGYRSYAEFNVKPNMSSSPEVVMSFLREMSKMVRPSADEVLCPLEDIFIVFERISTLSFGWRLIWAFVH